MALFKHNITLLFTVFDFDHNESSSREISQSIFRKLISFQKLNFLLKLKNLIIVEPL